jgi:hypothetical protein
MFYMLPIAMNLIIFDEDKELKDAGFGDVQTYGDRRRDQNICEREGEEITKIY